MPIESTVIIVAAVIAALLVVGALIALPRMGERGAPDAAARDLGDRRPADKYALVEASDPAAAPVAGEGIGFTRAVRIAWWVSIAAVLVGVGLSAAFPETQALIFVIGGAAALAVVALHELAPARWRLGGRVWIEGLVALALVTALVWFTGRGDSPFFIGYPIVTVAVALARGARWGIATALVASAAYGATILGPELAVPDGPALLRYGANLVATWLLTGLAAAYAGQERRARDRFLRMSLIDPLTGLYNRGQIFPTLDQEIRRTRRSDRGFCLLMIDLDGLKAMNDSYGHHRGDDVLRHLGTVIRRSIRTVDSAYRYGGDEFVVLLPETDIVGAFVVAEKIRLGTEELGLALAIDGVEASVSIGLVSHPEDGLSVEELMIAADRAMYQAKALGKNQISGFPRVRRLPPALPPVEPAPPTPVGPADPAPAVEPPAAAAEVVGAPPPMGPLEPVPMATADEPVATDPLPAAAEEPAEADEDADEGPDHGDHPDDEPDPSEVRRQIAVASRSFDPDDQIRRAMDAFLGPGSRDVPRH